MLDFKKFYKPLGQHKTLGQGYKEWWVSQHPYSPSNISWYYGMTLLGDPMIVPAETQVFGAEPRTISAANGGEVEFTVDLNRRNYRNRSYAILASVSGTTPRSPLDGIYVPLVFDPVTTFVHTHANTWNFDRFESVMDDWGDATAHMRLQQLDPKWIGTTIHFSLVITNPTDYASPPLGVEVLP
jgi:hypothetical protein